MTTNEKTNEERCWAVATAIRLLVTLTLSPILQLACTSGEAATLQGESLASGRPLQRFEHEGAVAGAIFNRDMSRILSWSLDGTVRFWNVADGSLAAPPMRHQGEIRSAVFSSDENLVLT